MMHLFLLKEGLRLAGGVFCPADVEITVKVGK